MLIYIDVLTITAICGLLSLYLPEKTHKFLIVPALVLLLGFVGLRDYVSADWTMYSNIFSIYRGYSFWEARDAFPTEIGFALLNYIVASIGGDMHVVAFICAAALLFGIVTLSKDSGVNIPLALFVSTPYLLYVVGMGYTRQSAAIGFGFASIPMFFHQKWGWFILLSTLAVSFHYSAIVLIGLVVMTTKRRVTVAVLLGLPLLVLLLRSDRYSTYGPDGSGAVQASGVWMRIAIILIALAVVVTQRKAWAENERYFPLIKRGGILLVALMPLASVASAAVDRLILYLFYIYVLALANAIQLARPTRRWLTTSFIYVQAFGTFLLWFSLSSYARDYWIPYHFANIEDIWSLSSNRNGLDMDHFTANLHAVRQPPLSDNKENKREY